MSVLVPVPHCLDDCGFVILPEVWESYAYCLENGKIAKVSVLDENEVGYGSTEYIVFRAKDGITDPDFVYYLVCSSYVRDPAVKSMVGTSGRQRVQTDVVQNLEIEFPPLNVQRQIGRLLGGIDDKIGLNKAINKNLSLLVA